MRITRIAIFEVNVIIGIKVANIFNISSQISFAFEFAIKNLSYSRAWEFRILIRDAHKMLSFIILLSQSIVSWLALNNFFTFQKINQNEIQIIGTIESTAKASFQSIINNKTLVQIIRNIDEIIDGIA